MKSKIKEKRLGKNIYMQPNNPINSRARDGRENG